MCDQNVVPKLARNHSSLANVYVVSKLHGICTNEFGTAMLVGSAPISTLIDEEIVKEGADHQVILDANFYKKKVLLKPLRMIWSLKIEVI